MQKAQNNCNYPSSETRQKYGILTEDKAISHKKLEKVIKNLFLEAFVPEIFANPSTPKSTTRLSSH
jgi:hypothetical protein